MSIRDTYAEQAWEFALPSARNEPYLVLGLWGEAGELASLMAKSIRDETELDKTAAAKELGDIMWFIASTAMFEDVEEYFTDLLNDAEATDSDQTIPESTGEVIEALLRTDLIDLFDSIATLAHRLGYTLDEVLEMNLAKLQSRRDRGKITGSGDDR